MYIYTYMVSAPDTPPLPSEERTPSNHFHPKLANARSESRTWLAYVCFCSLDSEPWNPHPTSPGDIRVQNNNDWTWCITSLHDVTPKLSTPNPADTLQPEPCMTLLTPCTLNHEQWAGCWQDLTHPEPCITADLIRESYLTRCLD